MRAPRDLPADVRDHVLICKDDEIARGLWRRLQLLDIPCYLLEPDPALASNLVGDGLPAVGGEIDSRQTYASLGVARARMVVVNLDDATNTNVTLTIREEKLAPDPGGLAVWTLPSYAALTAIARDLDETHDPVRIETAGVYNDIGREIL
jgi:voltage-gated potassium channel Kch